jgi:hypothetical protein
MYSPRNSYDHTANDDLNSLMQPMTEQLNLINIYDGVPQQHKNNSVDSLLIHNTPSPPQSFINYPNFTHNNTNNQPVSYRKVRPEPIRYIYFHVIFYSFRFTIIYNFNILAIKH